LQGIIASWCTIKLEGQIRLAVPQTTLSCGLCHPEERSDEGSALVFRAASHNGAICCGGFASRKKKKDAAFSGLLPIAQALVI